MIIIKADKEDLVEILNLQYIAYQSEAQLCNNPKIPPLTQTLEEVKEEFKKGVFLKVIDNNKKIIASVRAYYSNDTLHIGKLIVHPDLRGQGIGTNLLMEIEKICPCTRYELFTSSKSKRNIKLYERIGYVKFKEQNIEDDLKFIYMEKYSK